MTMGGEEKQSMETVLVQPERRGGERPGGIPERVLSLLPYALGDELRRLSASGAIEQLDLHGGGVSSVTRAGQITCLSRGISVSDMAELLGRLCDGGVYAFADSIRQGYISLPGGIRVGVCGRLRRDGDRILGVSEVNTLSFRFPGAVAGDVTPIRRLLERHPGQGVLIWGPPGVGKTTVLRSVVRLLATPPLSTRVAVVDTREELSAGLETGRLCAHWLFGYERARGIEIAVRTLSAQVVVCDEIGAVAEAGAMNEALGAGVALVASCHGGDAEQVKRRPGIKLLWENGVFGSLVGVRRGSGSGGGFFFDIEQWGR